MSPKYLFGMADLVARWAYTRQGVHKLTRCVDFPEPWGVFNQGRTKLWQLGDVEVFERLHPEVLDEGCKKQKIVGYYLAATGQRISSRSGRACPGCV